MSQRLGQAAGLGNLSSSGSSSSGSPRVTNPISHQSKHHQLNPSSTDPQSSIDLVNQDPTSISKSQREADLQLLLKQLDELKYYQASSSPLPSVIGSQKQKEFIDKIHKTLPLFLNMFGTNTNTQQPTASGNIRSSNLNPSRFGGLSADNNNPTPSHHSSLDRDIDSHSLCSMDSNMSLATKTPTSPCPPRDLPTLERYPIIQSFSYTIARVFVAEVRQRASNKKAEDASLAILEYLNPEIKKLLKKKDIVEQSSDQLKENLQQPQEDISHGWNMLQALQILAISSQQNSQIIQSLCDASLPSTLMKCLYLFFDLECLAKLQTAQSVSSDEKQPETNDDVDGANLHDSIMSPLIRVFTKILVHLCNSRAAIDELIKKDDLRLLFCLASTQCEKHNQPWRNTAFETLSSISKTMRDNFTYLTSNNCILNYVENLHKLSTMATISLTELVDMTKCLSEFVYNLETNNRNQIRSLSPIVEQLVVGRFIDFVEEILIKLDDLIEGTKYSETGNNSNSNNNQVLCSSQQQQQQQISIEEYRRLGRQLIKILPMISKINTHPDSMSELLTLKPCATTRYEMFDHFKMPKPSALHSILNLDALRLLKTAWSRFRDIYMIESILDATITLFHHDKYNYFIFENQQLLVYFLTSENFMSFPVRLKQKLFKFIEFITIETNYIPCLELGTLGSMMKQEECTNIDLILIMKTLIACLRINSKFSDIFREIGLLEITIEIFSNSMKRQRDYLQRQVPSQGQTNNSQSLRNNDPTQCNSAKLEDNNNIEVLYLSLEVNQCLLSGPNNANCIQFNESGAARQVFSCLSKPQQFYPIIQHHSSSSEESTADLSLSCSSPGAGAFINLAARSGCLAASDVPTPPLSSSMTTTTTATVRTPSNQMITAAHQQINHRPTIKQIQKVSFNIIRQLILSSAGDEHLANLLGLLARSMEDVKIMAEAELEASNFPDASPLTSSSTDDPQSMQHFIRRIDLTSIISHEINLKICILKSLMIVLKESHRCRTLFRKTGGFLCVISALEALGKTLPAPTITTTTFVDDVMMDESDDAESFAMQLNEKAADEACVNQNQQHQQLPLRDSSSKDHVKLTNQSNDVDVVQILRNLNSRRIWRLIKSCLMTMVIAMRFEPANIRAFTDDALTRFTEAIRLLGCFCADSKELTRASAGLFSQGCETPVGGLEENTSGAYNTRLDEYTMAKFKSIFLAAPTRDYSTIAADNITADSACCQLIRFLYDMSLDMGDGTADLEQELDQIQHYMTTSTTGPRRRLSGSRTNPFHQQHHHHGPAVSSECKSMSFDRANQPAQTTGQLSSGGKESDMFRRRSQLNAAPKRPPSLDLNTSRHSTPANLTFPNLILSILDLLPSCPSQEMMIFTSLVVKSLFKHERNRQLLCEFGLISKLLDKNLQIALVDKQHFLHEIFEFLFEKLSKELMTTRELTSFLRIGEPMLCANLDEIETHTDNQVTPLNSPVPAIRASKSPSAADNAPLELQQQAAAAEESSNLTTSDESNYMSATSSRPQSCTLREQVRLGHQHQQHQYHLNQSGAAIYNGEKICRDKVDSLVAMMNPALGGMITQSSSAACNIFHNRAPIQHQRDMSQPAFVEFDMSLEGLSLIFMPSIAPINVKLLAPQSSKFLNSTLDVHTNEKNGLLGGVGSQERQFPPPNGLTFSSWICINTFPSRSSDPNHNLRLLTIYRGSASTGKEYSCLRAEISALDRALIVSTQETLLFDSENYHHHHQTTRASTRATDSTSQLLPECNFRIWTPELLLENRWHHLAITLHRSSPQSTSPNVVVYVDGVAAHTDRLSYISQLVGPANGGPLGQLNAAAGPSAAAFVNAFIGSLPQFRPQPQVRWKQGPLHLIEEPLSSSFVAVIYALGPRFIGNFQSSIKLNELARARLLQLAQSDLKFFKQLETSKAAAFKHHQSLHGNTGANHNVGKQGQSPDQHQQQHQHRLSRAASSSGHSPYHSAHHNQQQASPSHNNHQLANMNSNNNNNANQYTLPEERLLISIHARATSLMTLARMRKIYTRFDCRQISRVLGLSLQENSTSILLLHNTCLHLTGPSRGVGAVTIGYNLVRFFVPNPVHHTLTSMGGCHILMAFIAQAETVESFESSMMALVCALRQNSILQAQMDSINGYQILEMFLWKKRDLLNETILSLIFSLITDTTKTRHFDQEPKTLIIQQVGAVRDLICECFDLWTQTNHIDSVLEFIYELINSANCSRSTLATTSSSAAQSTQSSSMVAASGGSSASSRSGGQAQLAALMSSARNKNLKCLRDLDLLPAILRLLPHYNSSIVTQQQQQLATNDSNTSDISPVNEKAIYLIRQIVYELLNKTPRQSDLLYFGQFVASLLPLEAHEERSANIVNLRNILLKSLLQMMTKNKQPEVNKAMQEEMVRILGFDWFMLFFANNQLNPETITIGFLNFMVVLSNDDLYAGFKQRNVANTFKGGWLKEPYFGSIDGKFNIQLLGMNVGFFFGTGTKRKSIRQAVVEAPNLFLLTCCLQHLSHLSNIYLMLLMLIMNKFNEIDPMTLDTIGTFEELSFDSLCDCLVGETHHQRRQTLSTIQLKCHELIVSLVYMIREIMSKPYDGSEELKKQQQPQREIEEQSSSSPEYSNKQKPINFPTNIIKFLMYLYNNNQDFQFYSRRSEEFMQALCECFMMQPNKSSKNDHELDSPTNSATQLDWIRRAAREQINMQAANAKQSQPKSQHPATAELLEICKLIILDSMTEVSRWTDSGDLEPLHALEIIINQLDSCPEFRDQLMDSLMTHILLMIDSTARNNSSQTLGSSNGMIQFQMLLVNSILVAQFATDRIWSNQLYQDDLNNCTRMIEHQLCLTEQVFKFNELLPPKQNPSHAFIMQRTLNRILLFALSPSRPVSRGSDKMLQLELLKRIHHNRNIIIFNHMSSEHSAEFFVCLTYCLLRIMDSNTVPTPSGGGGGPGVGNNQSQQAGSLIERKFGHQSSMDQSNSSNALMIYSMARKVWDSLFQGQKAVLSEALEVSLSLPAFTLDTSIDLMQLKPDIELTCERYWNQFVDVEQRPRPRRSASRLNQKDSQQSSGAGQSSSGSAASNAATSAVNLLSGRLTKVVNAASFVSRVVGVTAGNMASNVNLVGERLSQSGSRRKQDFQSEKFNQSSGASQQQQQTSSFNGDNNQGVSSLAGALNQINQTRGLFTHENLSRAEVDSAFKTHVMIIEDYISSHLAQKNHKLALHKYVCDDWLDMEHEILLRERAIFGPTKESKLDKWCLDMTEGPKRMRKKMFNNTRFFYENYPYKAELHNPDNKSLRYRPPMSFHCQEHYFKTSQLNQNFLSIESSPSQRQQQQQSQQSADASKQSSEFHEAMSGGDLSSNNKDDSMTHGPKINVNSPSPTESDAINEEDKSRQELASSMNGDSKTTDNKSSALQAAKSTCSIAGSDVGDASNLAGDDGDSTSFGDFDPEIEAETNSARESENIDSLSVLRLLEKNERISHMFRCSRVLGLDTHEGLMLFGKEHFYLIDGFTLLKTREIKDIDSLPADAHDPIIPNSTPNLQAHSSKKICAKFAFDGVVEVHKRRYLLQPIALEVFSSDGRNSLIVFPRNIRNKVYGRLMSVSTQLNCNAHESLAGQKSNVSVEGGGGLFSSLIGETSVTQRWVRGELSNFQYLMNLNTIAGRSYNDLMQYPIFPWILADYTSEYLDLTKPTTFRDLSRPIGAQTGERLEQFKRRFAEWDDTETPPYHYGTFYSSAMIVASYMVRMEPFTQHFLRLQGGHFDLADRMFHSINDSWMSASKHNMADIKELIPEFFYLPEFLINQNRYDLGIKQNGNRLDNVILPPWAKNDAREFIRLHRSALESEYVSAHLHEWIDLIFGYKQQGQAAIDAVNVFHHLFYEGNVDIYNTDIDPIRKNAVIGFINNFGQVPKQLFKKPHPARKVLHLYGQGSTSHLSGTPSPILPSLSVATGGGGAGHSMSANQQHPGARNLTYCPQALRLSTLATNLKELRGPVGQIVHVDKTLVAVEQNKLLIPPEYCRYVAWGHADRSLRLGLYDSEKSIFVWEGSDGMAPSDILCCTIPNSRTIITAGMDCMLTVWKIERMKSFVPTLNLYGHTEPVTCLASSQAYSLIVSGSRDRSAIIWDLNRFTFLRQLGGGHIHHPAPISAIAINDSTGDIATCASNWLFLWTINGELLAKVDSLQASIKFQAQNPNSFFPSSTISGNMGQLHILSVCFSQFREWSRDEVIVTGGSDGSIAIWSMRYTQKPISKRKPKKVERCSEVDEECLDQQATRVSDKSAVSNRIESIDSTDEVIIDTTNSSSGGQNQPMTEEQQASMMAAIKDNAVARRRERSDTINSDWVKLSNSSASTTDIVEPPSQSSADRLIAKSSSELVKVMQSFTMSEEAELNKKKNEQQASSVPNPISSTPFKQQFDDSSSLDVSPRLAEDLASMKEADRDSLQPQQLGQTSKLNLLLNASDPSLMKFSKSDSSIVDSFVILGESSPINPSSPSYQANNRQQQQNSSDNNRAQPRPKSSVGGSITGKQRLGATSSTSRDSRDRSSMSSEQVPMLGRLSPGHEWSRELYLRTILSRRDNRNNSPSAAVTSLTISKNHRTIFVGDASGKVTSWSV